MSTDRTLRRLTLARRGDYFEASDVRAIAEALIDQGERIADLEAAHPPSIHRTRIIRRFRRWLAR